MTPLAPFILDPVLVERPWGGETLGEIGKAVPSGITIGESWEVADLPPDVAPHLPRTSSSVASGPLVGHSLAHVVDRHADELMGDASLTDEGRFPLLIKLLDSGEPLSIQVHPDAGYVDDHPEARLKTESWYIVRATDKASLLLDVVDGTTRDDLAAAFGTPAMLQLLDHVPARPGAFYHLPSGLIHSLGGGCLVAEVQTPSDTTFRLYDWAEEYGRAPRPLHREEALASIRLHPPEAYSLPPSDQSRSLITNSYYSIDERHLHNDRVDVATDGGPIVVMAIEGAIRLDDLDMPAGTTAIVPAATESCTVTANGAAVFLEIRP